MMSFDPSLVRYTEAQSQQFFEQVAERARAVPGVKSVAMTTSVPMSNDSIGSVTIVPEGFQFPAGKDNVTVLASSVDEHYFDTMGIAMLEGRNFRADDHADAPRVAIVNQPFAQHYWPNQDPIGKRFQTLGDEKDVGADRRPREDEQVHLHRRSRRRSSSTCRTGRRSPRR